MMIINDGGLFCWSLVNLFVDNFMFKIKYFVIMILINYMGGGNKSLVYIELKIYGLLY